MSNLYIEKYQPVIRLTGGLKTKLPMTLSGTAATLAVGGTLTVTGASTFTGAVAFNGGTSSTGALTVTSTSANALAVGANGTTNPVLKIDANTASVATGVSVVGAAAAGGVAVAAISSGTDESLTLNAKGSGTVTINGTATGNIVLGRAATGVSLSTTGSLTSVSAGALTSGGNTVPALLFSGTASFGVYFGADAPTISAAKGSLYLASNGTSTSTRLYVNNGTTNWIAITTAS